MIDVARSAHHAIATVLNEIINGSEPQTGWLLNPGDVGLLRSLDTLSAEQASAAPAGGGAHPSDRCTPAPNLAVTE